MKSIAAVSRVKVSADGHGVVSQRMTIDEHPMRSFFAMHEGPLSGQDERDYPKDNMFAAYRVVEALSQVSYSRDTFDRIRSRDLEHFPTTRVNGNLQTVEQSAAGMRILLHFVQEIEDSGWPSGANGAES